jgi:hypothetical protein
MTPRPMHFQMLLGNCRRDFLQLLHKPPQAVAIFTLCDQYSISGGNHHQIFNSEQRDQMFIAHHMTAARIDKHNRTLREIVQLIAI